MDTVPGGRSSEKVWNLSFDRNAGQLYCDEDHKNALAARGDTRSSGERVWSSDKLAVNSAVVPPYAGASLCGDPVQTFAGGCATVARKLNRIKERQT